MHVAKSLAMGCLALVAFCLLPAHAGAAMSPLAASILSEDIDGTRAALDAGESPNAPDPELQRVPLQIAVSPGSPRAPAIVELLVSRGADLNAEDARTGLTPLMAASIVVETAGPFAVLEFQKSKFIVERLLNLGADPARASQAGETPLLVAVSAGNLEVLRLLIARGARPDQAGTKGETPLARATKLKRMDMSSALLAAGATPLPPQVAARGGFTVPETAAADTAAAAAEGAGASSSGISGWLIGGLAVAAGVVAAAVAANNAKKRQNAANTAQATAPVPAPIATPPVAPPAPPRPAACPPGHALVNGICQLSLLPQPLPGCAAPLVMQNGACVMPTVLPGPQPLPPAPPQPATCAAPQVLQNGVCVALPPTLPPVTPPVLPPAVCSPPLVFQNGACVAVTPPVSAPPVLTDANPVDLAALRRSVMNNGPTSVTVNWTGPASSVVTNVSIAFTWACASGARTFAARAVPAAGASSALVQWFPGNTAVGCPEFPGTGNGPSSAVINLTYKANGTGPDLVVSRPYGQLPCLSYIPDPAAFPVTVAVNELWSSGGAFQFNRQLANPYGYAAFSGLDEATLKSVFRVCNGRFVSAYGSRERAPTATDPQHYRNTVQAANGMLTFTEQVTRPGAAISENAIFTYRYSITTGEYSFSATGGQRNAFGASSVISASRTGQAKLRLDASGPQDPDFVPSPPDVAPPVPICAAPMVLQSGACIAAVVIPAPPPGTCVPPQVMQNGGCISMPNPPMNCAAPLVMQGGVCVAPPPVCGPSQALQNGACVTLQAVTRIDNTPRVYDYVPGKGPQYFLWQMNAKILAIGVPRVPLQGGVVEVSGIGTTMLMVTVWAGGYSPGQIPGTPGSVRQVLDLDVTLEVPPAGSPPPVLNSTERIQVQNKNLIFPSSVPQVFTQKVRSKIVRIFDVSHSDNFAATVRYEGIGTDTLTITVLAGGYSGTALASFSVQVMY